MSSTQVTAAPLKISHSITELFTKVYYALEANPGVLNMAS